MQKPRTSQDLTGDQLRICYCDFDGVTHFDSAYSDADQRIFMREPGHELFEWAPILDRLLTPFPDIKIVLSTSWVRVKGLDYAKRRLPPSLQSRVIGATFDNRIIQKLDFDLMPRGIQVVQDVERRELTRWFAIDNDDQGWPEWSRGRLIKTDDRRGLSEFRVQEEIEKMLGSL